MIDEDRAIVSILPIEALTESVIRYHEEKTNSKFMLRIIKMANELGLKGRKIKSVSQYDDIVKHDQVGVVFNLEPKKKRRFWQWGS